MKGKMKSKKKFVGPKLGRFTGVNLLRAIIVMICLALLTVAAVSLMTAADIVEVDIAAAVTGVFGCT